MWNVDETIHTAIAQTLLDGGLIYRDAIDQRTPLTYYVFAVVFAITGVELPAIRILIAAMIVGTCLMLGKMVRSLHGNLTAVLAVVGFGSFSSYLLFPSDSFAANTEWFVVFFTAAAASTFWGNSSSNVNGVRCVWTGVLLGLAALSKQSALLEAAPAGCALLTMGVSRHMSWHKIMLCGGAILSGFSLVIAVSVIALTVAGAGSDYFFYAWTYNLQYYGPEIKFLDKLASGLPWFAAIWTNYPILFIFGVGAAIGCFLRTVQLASSARDQEQRPKDVYLLTWCIASFGGALSGGRGFDHYFIPCLAPFAWMAARGAGAVVSVIHANQTQYPRVARVVAGLIVMGFVGSALIRSAEAREIPAPQDDPAMKISDVIRDHVSDDDSIFVWGFNPDIYYYSGTKPASRFVYCTFQTGLVPWTNVAPEVDTTYAIVPGAMDDLLADLEFSAPRVIVDCSDSSYRHFDKYPLSKFPRLETWIDEQYRELNSKKIRQHGFRIFLRRDAVITTPRDSVDSVSTTGVRLADHINLVPGLNRVEVQATSNDDPIVGVDLKLNGRSVGAVTVADCSSVDIIFPLLLAANVEQVTLHPWVRRQHSGWESGQKSVVKVSAFSATIEQALEFALPVVRGRLSASGVRAPFGASTNSFDGHRNFAMHAPSLLRYDLPADAARISGAFGLPAGAYASDNPSPTDGAEFIVRVRQGNKTAHELLRRLVIPNINPDDAGIHAFDLELPVDDSMATLEFEITPGPSGVSSSDWTFWSDLRIETSP